MVDRASLLLWRTVEIGWLRWQVRGILSLVVVAEVKLHVSAYIFVWALLYEFLFLRSTASAKYLSRDIAESRSKHSCEFLGSTGHLRSYFRSHLLHVFSVVLNFGSDVINVS